MPAPRSLDQLEPTDEELAAQVWALHQQGREDWHVIADRLELASTSHARSLYQLHQRQQDAPDVEQPTLF